MPWQIIVTLLALAAIAGWMWRRLDARAAELGPKAFEATARAQPSPALPREAAPAGAAGPPTPESPPSGGPAPPEEQG